MTLQFRSMGWTALGFTGFLLLPGWTCAGGGNSWNTPDDEGIPFDGPPGDAPTGQRFDEIEIEDGCGRTQLAFRLVDEICGTATPNDTTLPDEGDLAAPMFRDGAIVFGNVWAVDGTHLWILDGSLATGTTGTTGAQNAATYVALTAGVGEAIAIAATSSGTAFIAGGEAGLIEVGGAPNALAVVSRASFDAPVLDVAIDESGIVLVAAAEAGLVIDAAAVNGLPVVVDVGAPAVAVGAFGARAFVATCDGLVVVDIASAQVIGSARGASWVPGATVDGLNHAPAKDVAVARLGSVSAGGVREIAFVAAGRWGAVGVDVTDPTSPTVVGNCTNVDDPAHYVSGVKVDAARGMLAIAAGERGVVAEPAPLASCASGLSTPTVRDPVSLVDDNCAPRPPWQIITNESWEPPPPGKDPVQLLLVNDIALAFGDARRNALRAVDAWQVPTSGGTVDVGLVHVGRAEEPRALVGIAAGGRADGRIIAVGGRLGGVFTVDELGALARHPSFVEPIVGVPAVLLDGAIGALDVVTGGSTTLRIHRADAATLEIALPGRIAPHALTVRDDGALVVAREASLSIVDPLSGGIDVTPLSRVAALAPAIVSVGDDVIVAAPEWDAALMQRPAGQGSLGLAPHGAFSADEILDLSSWRHGPPRRTLARATDAPRLLEVAVLADRAALVVSERNTVGFTTVVEGPVPAAPYNDAALTNERAFLLAHDAARYRSELMTVDITSGVPEVIAVQSWSGAAVALVELDGRIYVADADGEVRIYDALAADGATLTGIVDLRGAP